MRFILFNVVVVAALFYLFSGDKSDVDSISDSAHKIVDRAEAVATTTVDRVKRLMEENKRHIPPAVHDRFAHSGDPATNRDATESAVEPSGSPSAAVHTPVVTDDAPSLLDEDSRERETVGKRVDSATGNLEPSWVSERPVRAVPKPAGPRQEREDDPIGADGSIVSKPVATNVKASGNKTRIVIAEGESLMTPQQRRKELHALAEEMELLYLRRAGN